MRFADVVNQKKFSLVVRVDPPKGTDLTQSFHTLLGIRGRVDGLCFSDSPMAIMRMHPIAPCHLLQQKNVETILNINGRDRNRLSFQSELLAAWALGIRSVLLCEGEDPSFGDHPLTVPCKDLTLEGMLEAILVLKEGKDLAGEPVEQSPSFHAGVDIQVTDDPEVNTRNASSLGRLAKQGVQFVFLGSTYDGDVIREFAQAASGTGIKLFASVMILKSLGMAKYLNSIKGVPNIPEAILDRMAKAPIKQKAGLEIAAGFMREVEGFCDGAVILPLGWESRVAELLDLFQG